MRTSLKRDLWHSDYTGGVGELEPRKWLKIKKNILKTGSYKFWPKGGVIDFALQNRVKVSDRFQVKTVTVGLWPLMCSRFDISNRIKVLIV